MTDLSRRHALALLTGGALAPLLPAVAPVVAPVLVTRYQHTVYGLGYAITKTEGALVAYDSLMEDS